MQALRGAIVRRRGVAAVLVFLVSAAVVFASSHCEVGGMETGVSHETSCCAAVPVDTSAPLEYSQCCASLDAPIPSVAHAPVAELFEIHAVWAAIDLLAPIVTGGDAVLVCRANPPPGCSPFLELVLRGSAPAHGPPIFVA